MTKSKELLDASKNPKPPPIKPILDSFAKGKGFMPPPTRPPNAPFNAVLHAFELSKANSSASEHVSEKSVLSPRREPSDYEQVSEAELDAYIAVQGSATPTATTPASSPKSPSEILRKDMHTASLKAEEHLGVEHAILPVPEHAIVAYFMQSSHSAALRRHILVCCPRCPQVVCPALSVSNRTNLNVYLKLSGDCCE
eukprot:6201567-Pleurochrysis_carterae.AAC.1